MLNKFLTGGGSRQRALRSRLHLGAADGTPGLRGCQVPRGAERLQAVDRRLDHGSLSRRLFRTRRAGRTSTATCSSKFLN
jgi:hypothetical protein